MASLGLTLMALPAERAGALLRSMPLDAQADAILWLTNATPLSLVRGFDPQDATDLEDLRVALQVERSWTLEKVAAAVRQSAGGEALRQILITAWERDEPAAAALQTHLFGLGDLTQLSDAELQHVLGQIDNGTLALALTGADEALVQRFLVNVSDRRAVLIREDGELYAEAEIAEVERARARLMATARYLYEKGQVRVYLGSVAHSPQGMADEEEAEAEPSPEASQSAPAEQDAPERAASVWPRRIGMAGAAAILALALMGITYLVGGPGGPAGQTSPSAAGRPPVRPEKRGPRALVQGDLPDRTAVEPTDEARQRERPAPDSSPHPLGPGETFRSGEVDAVLQFPGVTDGGGSRPAAAGGTVEVSPATEVKRPEVEGRAQIDEPTRTSEGGGDLYLRMGRVRVTVTGASFSVRTPVVLAWGETGSVYRVRVTLDGTTEVRVESGQATLRPVRDLSLAVPLGPGECRRVRPSR